MCLCDPRHTEQKHRAGHTHFIPLLTCSKSPQTSLSMIPTVSAMDEDTKASSLKVIWKN